MTTKYDPRVQMESLFFTNPVLKKDMRKHLNDYQKKIENLAGEILKANKPKLYFLGGGASLSAMMSAEYLLTQFTNIPAQALNGVEFLSRAPETLDQGTFCILTSWSGETPEILKAQQYAKNKGAKTIVLTKSRNTALAQAADQVIVVESKAVYIVPLQVVYLLSGYLIRGCSPVPTVGNKLLDDLVVLPEKLGDFVWQAEVVGKKAAEKFKDVKVIYVMASGPQYGLGYKLALSVIIENLWIDSSIVNVGEFYHGPIEIISNGYPAFIFIVGKDASRENVLKEIKFAKKKGNPYLVFDVADYPVENGLLAPFYAFVVTEWFIMYMAAQRDHNVDERHYMGKVASQWGEF